jgi:DNA-directed RNA polymerase specialized sigma24 family protein
MATQPHLHTRSTLPLLPHPEATLECLLSRLHRIHALLLRRGFSDAVASRAVEEVLRVGMKALENGKAARMSPEHRAGWLWRVAVRAARRGAVREVVRFPLSFDPPDNHSRPSEEVTPLLLALYEAVDHLPERQRRAIELHFFQGLSVRQAARETGVRESTAAYHLREARASLVRTLSALVPGLIPGEKGSRQRNGRL